MSKHLQCFHMSCYFVHSVSTLVSWTRILMMFNFDESLWKRENAVVRQVDGIMGNN